MKVNFNLHTLHVCLYFGVLHHLINMNINQFILRKCDLKNFLFKIFSFDQNEDLSF
jgi:hypothetical protein